MSGQKKILVPVNRISIIFFYQMNIKGQEMKIYQLFLVQIGNEKSQKN